jgi:arginine utilization protein RocB
MRYLFIITSAIVMYSISSWANCSDVIADLRAMKEAQTAIQSSLVSNHAMFASTLESYSDALTETAGKAHKVVSSNMMSSAESFRNRGLQARKTALKLEDATEELIQRISKCIK